MKPRFAYVALLVLAQVTLALGAPAAAQTRRQPQQPQQQQQEPQPRTEEWYRGQLSELSEVLGGSHYLRILCDGRRDQRWRDYMRGVLSREPRYHDQLVEGFNRGYRQEESRFSDCNQSATQAEAELRARGLRVAGGLSARYGD
ncbi:Mll7793 protein [alpha proteobacterium U9-1i]|nr:Mll7793 protein [alpha proteobacterium U9-1i]